MRHPETKAVCVLTPGRRGKDAFGKKKKKKNTGAGNKTQQKKAPNLVVVLKPQQHYIGGKLFSQEDES